MATVKITFRRKKLGNGDYPVVIRLQHLKNPTSFIRLKGMTISCEEEWENELSRFTRKKDEWKSLNKLVAEIEETIEIISTKLESTNQFSYKKFRDLYLKPKVSDGVYSAFKTKIEELTSLKKYGTAESYQASCNALKKHYNNKALVFSDLDYIFLKGFENQLRKIGNSGTTISYKLRPLRALHNNFCNEAELPLPTSYKRFNMGRLVTATKKRSLTQKQFKSLVQYKPSTNSEQIAKDIFMFSFYGRGISVADIAQLKPSNIIDDKILYTRGKTGKHFAVSMNESIMEIIKRYDGAKYLFPILKNYHTNTKYSIRLFTKFINNNLDKISKKIEIPRITTYWSRHTFAQLSRESGVSTELISAALGHSDLKTTEIYLKSFENKELDNITTQILSNL